MFPTYIRKVAKMLRAVYPLDDCGLFYYVGSKPLALPLDGVHVSVRIVNFVAEVQVVQFYGMTYLAYLLTVSEPYPPNNRHQVHLSVRRVSRCLRVRM
jgi:hypothetical protein